MRSRRASTGSATRSWWPRPRRSWGWTSPSSSWVEVADLGDDELHGALQRLEEHEIAEPVGSRRAGEYRFTHGLLQETAYASVLRARRQELHSRVADVMTASLTSMVEHRPELLAHHLTEAGRVAEAIAAWERASRQAFSASALAESEAHVRTALALVDQLGPDEDPIGVEMGLQILLGRVASATHGMASSVVRQSYARALDLGESGRGAAACGRDALRRLGRGVLAR